LRRNDHANSEIDFTVNRGDLRGIIGPNGAGKSTFFKMLTCEVPPSAGQILFEGRDITGATVADVCQLGLTKSYQINQLFNRLTVRENITIAALAALRGKFRLDLFKSLKRVSGLDEQIEHTLALVGLAGRANTPVSGLAYGEKRRLEVGLALATSPSLLLLVPTDSVILRTIGVGAFGVSAGAQMPSYTNLSTRYYGMRSFGTLSSLAGIATQIPTAIAPFIAGVLFDVTGGYTVMLVAGIPILLISSLFLLSLGPIPVFKPDATAPGDQAVAATT